MNTRTDALDLSRNALNLRTYRQELLASNLANADTPNYKARDFDFKAALASSMSGAGSGLNKTSTRHLDAGATGDARSVPGVSVQYRGEYQGAVDGNTVNVDIERGAFAENSVHVEALLTFVREHVKVMNLALQG